MSNPSPAKRRRTNDAEATSNVQSTLTPKTPSRLPEPGLDTNTKDNETEDWTSSSGSDSDSDSNPDSNSLTTNPPHPLGPPETNNTIHTRLTSFFSQLAEQRANPETATEKIELDSDDDSGFEDEGDERRGGEYIELDLALGVLSEKGSDDEGEDIKVKLPGRDGKEESDEDESDDQAGLAKLTAIATGGGTRRKKGAKKGEEKRKIQEVE